MKNAKIYFTITIAILVFSCTPDNRSRYNTEFVKVLASIEKSTENILLGDTIKIKLTIPDTIVTNGITKIVQNLQRGQFGMEIFKYDTVNKRVIGIVPPLLWVSKGNNEGNLSFVCNTDSKPFVTQINIKPIEKGLYRINLISQLGQFRINNNSYEANLFVNFNVPNKHFNILSIVSPYFGGQPYYDAFIQKDIDGFGVYFFRVI